MILRLIGYIFIDIVFELVIKMPGYLILRTFKDKNDINTDGFAVVFLGVMFWITLIISYFVFIY